MVKKSKTRCFWVNLDNPVYVDYHDKEWGRVNKDDQYLFEMLILEGAQAGLSWETVLNKRQEYRKVFKNFDIKKCSKLKNEELEIALLNPGIIRNRLKVYSVPINAQKILEMQKEFGSFANYLWSFIEHKPIVRTLKKGALQTSSDVSDAISKDLKKRGFKFVGTTIIYAYMQAIGMINEHFDNCFLCNENKNHESAR